MWLFGRALATGIAEPRSRIDELPGRLVDVGIYFFGQKKVAEEGPQHRTSRHHLFIFWGFLIITIATIEIFLSGVWPRVSLRLLPAFVYTPIYMVIDVFNAIVLLVIIWAIARRTLVKPRLIPWNLDAGLILGAIGSLMLTHFIFHGYEIAAQLTAHQAAPSYLPVSSLVGKALAPLSPEAAERGHMFGYW